MSAVAIDVYSKDGTHRIGSIFVPLVCGEIFCDSCGDCLDCYDGDNVELDTWHHDDLFEDCTHGYLVSASPQMVADLVVGWFRERCGFAEPDVIGFAYMRAKSLPRTANRIDWMSPTASRSPAHDS